MFKDRTDAGQVLAGKLSPDQYDSNTCLLAVPRGGVVVAAPIAIQLNVRLGVLVTRKIGHPLNSEVAVGAVMPDGSAVCDHDLLERFRVGPVQLNQMIQKEYGEIKRRMLTYTGSDQPQDVEKRTVVIVDDGIATGYTIRAAVQWLKTLNPAKIVIAVPVAPPDVAALLANEVDHVICPLQPDSFGAVGMYYKDFSQTTDNEVLLILRNLNQK